MSENPPWGGNGRQGSTRSIGGSKSPGHAIMFHHTSVTKHNFNNTIIQNLKMVTAMEH